MTKDETQSGCTSYGFTFSAPLNHEDWMFVVNLQQRLEELTRLRAIEARCVEVEEVASELFLRCHQAYSCLTAFQQQKEIGKEIESCLTRAARVLGESK